MELSNVRMMVLAEFLRASPAFELTLRQLDASHRELGTSVREEPPTTGM